MVIYLHVPDYIPSHPKDAFQIFMTFIKVRLVKGKCLNVDTVGEDNSNGLSWTVAARHVGS